MLQHSPRRCSLCQREEGRPCCHLRNDWVSQLFATCCTESADCVALTKCSICELGVTSLLASSRATRSTPDWKTHKPGRRNRKHFDFLLFDCGYSLTVDNVHADFGCTQWRQARHVAFSSFGLSFTTAMCLCKAEAILCGIESSAMLRYFATCTTTTVAS